jgi:hypothetical protein
MTWGTFANRKLANPFDDASSAVTGGLLRRKAKDKKTDGVTENRIAADFG